MLYAIMNGEVEFPDAKAACLAFARSCPDCQSCDLRTKKHVVRYPIVAKEPLVHCQMDCVTYSMDSDGNCYLTNHIDLFSKFLHSIGIRCLDCIESLFLCLRFFSNSR